MFLNVFGHSIDVARFQHGGTRGLVHDGRFFVAHGTRTPGALMARSATTSNLAGGGLFEAFREQKRAQGGRKDVDSRTMRRGNDV